jgi:hypothetical protein
MEYVAALLGGVAASAVFWLVDKYLFILPQSYQIAGIVACFIIFGGAGFWFSSRAATRAPLGTRIASGLRGRDIKVNLDGVETSGQANSEILSDVEARRDIDMQAKNIKTKP